MFAARTRFLDVEGQSQSDTLLCKVSLSERNSTHLIGSCLEYRNADGLRALNRRASWPIPPSIIIAPRHRVCSWTLPFLGDDTLDEVYEKRPCPLVRLFVFVVSLIGWLID